MASHPSTPYHRAPEYHQDTRNHAYPPNIPPVHTHRNPQETQAVLGLLSLSPKMQATSLSLPPIRSLDQPPSHHQDGILLPPIAPRRGYYRPEMDAFENQTERPSRSVPHTPVPAPAPTSLVTHTHTPTQIPRAPSAQPIMSTPAFSPDQQVPRKRKRKSTPPMEQFTPPPTAYSHRIINNSYPHVSLPANGISPDSLPKDVVMSSATPTPPIIDQQPHHIPPQSTPIPVLQSQFQQHLQPPPPPPPPPSQPIPSSSSLTTSVSRNTPSPAPPGDQIRCRCGQNIDYGSFMIACDSCETWWHGTCVGIPQDAMAPGKWKCERCTGEGPSRQVKILKEEVPKVGRRRQVKDKDKDKVVEKDENSGKRKRQRRTTIATATPSTPVTPGGPPPSAPSSMTPASAIPPSDSFPPPPLLPSGIYAIGQFSPITPSIPSDADRALPALDPKSIYGYLPVHEDVVNGEAIPLLTNIRQQLMNSKERRVSTALWDGNDEDEEMTAPENDEEVDVDGSGPPSRDCEPNSLPPTDSTSIPNRTTIRPIPSYTASNQIRPPMFSLHSTEPIPANEVISPYVSELTSTRAYLTDPLNSYVSSGIPKPYVRLMQEISLDSRRVGNDARWARRGCHPNAVLRPMLCKKGKKETDESEKDGEKDTGSSGKEDAGKEKEKEAEVVDGEKEGDKEKDITDEEVAEVKFALFATQDLKEGDEVVLGWEWDDGHVVHQLPAIIESRYAGMGIRNHRRHRLKQTMKAFLHSLASTFQHCACGSQTRDCVVNQLAAFVENRESPPPTHDDPQAKAKPHLGKLVGIERGVRVRHDGKGGVRVATTLKSPIDKEAEAAKLMRDPNGSLFQRPSCSQGEEQEQAGSLPPRVSGKDLTRSSTEEANNNDALLSRSSSETGAQGSEKNKPLIFPPRVRKMAGRKFTVYNQQQDQQATPRPYSQEPDQSDSPIQYQGQLEDTDSLGKGGLRGKEVGKSNSMDALLEYANRMELSVAGLSIQSPENSGDQGGGSVATGGALADGSQPDLHSKASEREVAQDVIMSTQEPRNNDGALVNDRTSATPTPASIQETSPQKELSPPVDHTRPSNDHKENEGQVSDAMEVDVPSILPPVVEKSAIGFVSQSKEIDERSTLSPARKPISIEELSVTVPSPVTNADLPLNDKGQLNGTSLAALIFGLPSGSRPVTPPTAPEKESSPIEMNMVPDPAAVPPIQVEQTNEPESAPELEAERPQPNHEELSVPPVASPVPISVDEPTHREPSPAPAPAPKKVFSLSQWKQRRKKQNDEQPSPLVDTRLLPDAGSDSRITPETPILKCDEFGTRSDTLQVAELPHSPLVPILADPNLVKRELDESVIHPQEEPVHRGKPFMSMNVQETHTLLSPKFNGARVNANGPSYLSDSELSHPSAQPLEKHIIHESVPEPHTLPHLSPPSTRSSPQSDVRETTEPTPAPATPPDEVRVRRASPSASTSRSRSPYEPRIRQTKLDTTLAMGAHTIGPVSASIPSPSPVSAHAPTVPRSPILRVKQPLGKEGTEDGEIVLSPPTTRPLPIPPHPSGPLSSKPNPLPHPPTHPRALSARFSSPHPPHLHTYANSHVLPQHPHRFPGSRPPPAAPRAMVAATANAANVAGLSLSLNTQLRPQVPSQPRSHAERTLERERDRDVGIGRDANRDRDRERERDLPTSRFRDRDWTDRRGDRERDPDRDRRSQWDKDRGRIRGGLR